MTTQTHTSLISAEQLQALQRSGQPLAVFDCSFDLMQPEAGRAQFEQAHIPGARYVHLDTDLSAKTPGSGPAASSGRHPLPSREWFAAWLGRAGVHNGMQAVVYDRNGVNFCGRLWWMLKWVGHDHVAVLDGGLQAWLDSGGAKASGLSARASSTVFDLRPPLVDLVTSAQVLAGLSNGHQTLVDARATPRYKGEVEPLDPVAGHIPGALNRPFQLNLGADGRFKPAAQLKSEFESLLADSDPGTVVHHCGSGVSAVPNLLAMAIAGLGNTSLYAGSWSEWCSDPTRPVAQG